MASKPAKTRQDRAPEPERMDTPTEASAMQGGVDSAAERGIVAGREFHILNLGAGVQSTTLYLMSLQGKAPRFDWAIFADTGEEPQDVYAHLHWLLSLGEPGAGRPSVAHFRIPILSGTAGKLGDDLITGKRAPDRARCAAIPAYTTKDLGLTVGRTKRQCSKEYKTQVIDRVIRREILGLRLRQRIPKTVKIFQYFGISLDEKSRATRIWERFHVTAESRYEPRFPLLDMQMTRANCIDWLHEFGDVPHEVPRSACVFCPMHDDREWARLKTIGGPDWERAIQLDEALRDPASVMNRDMEQVMYLHRKAKPLVQIEFHPRDNPKESQLGFGLECEGVCGV